MKNLAQVLFLFALIAAGFYAGVTVGEDLAGHRVLKYSSSWWAGYNYGFDSCLYSWAPDKLQNREFTP